MAQPRVLESELMDLPDEARAYAAAAFGTVNQAFVDRLLEFLGNAPPALHLVDLGTGPADIPLRIAASRPEWEIVAVDGAAAMLDLARAAIAAAPRIQLVLADAKATGLPAHSFDVICSNSLLHHMLDPGPLWLEIKRLARPGATVFLRDLYRPDSAAAARQIVRQHASDESPLLQDEFHRSLLAAFTPNEIREQLRTAGLDALTVAVASDRHVDVSGRL